jgi:transcriptional regulator with XRE-family HTH domain
VGKPQLEVDPFRAELKELRVALGRRIRELRQSKGWSQEEFAAHAHIHRTFAGSLERGEKNLSFNALVLIARCFGITTAELLDGVEGADAKLPRRKAGTTAEIDRSRILLELAAAEKSIQLAKEIASSPENRQMHSITKKRRKE